MKKAYLLTALLLFSLCSCGNTATQTVESSNVVTEEATEMPAESPTEIVTEAQTDAPKETPNEPTAEDSSEEWDKQILFDEPVLIYDVNDLKIYQRGWGVARDSLVIAVLIENNTPYDIMLTTKYSSVNDFVVDDVFSPSIPSGKKLNDVIGFKPDDLEKAMVKAIDANKAEFVFYVYNDNKPEHYKEFDHDPVIIELKDN